MKNIVITGCLGFIGKNLLHFLTKDHRIYCFDRKKGIEGEESKNIFIITLDLSNNDLSEIRIPASSLIHLAAYTDSNESLRYPLKYIKNNFLGTANALEFCKANKISKFIFISSASVYGESKYIPINESNNPDPVSVYGYTKLWSEQLVKMYSRFYGIKYVILRLFNVYGPGQSPEYAGVITKFIDRVSRGLPPVIYGDGLQTRDFVHVYDVCRAIELAIEKDVQGTFNIGSGRPTRIIDLANMILRLMSREDLEPIFEPPREGDIRHSWADISKARKYLGYEPKISLEEGLKDLIENWDKYRKMTL